MARPSTPEVGTSTNASTSRPTSATIDLAAIRANFELAESRAPGSDAIAVVKADAYGHGAAAVARTLVDAGCRRFAVATVPEAVELREAGIAAPIVVLGGIADAAEASVAFDLALEPVVHSPGDLSGLVAAASSAEPLRVHVEVDTGMHRMGVSPADALGLLEEIRSKPALRLAGVYTHFARADEPDLSPTLEQLAQFRGLLDAARERGIEPPSIHAANSAGILAGGELSGALPEQNATRPGLMLYGVRPAVHLGGDLRPAMTLRTRVVAVRNVGVGRGVGYSAEFRASRDTRVATLAVGYEDGVPISASGKGSALIRGRRLPFAGRVSMDYVGIEVGSAAVEVGDEAIIFGGPQQGTRWPVEEAAAAAGTIAYELLVRVGRRVPRVYVDTERDPS